jgi:O-antigen/teichoic acid export membrane protein
VFVGQEVYWGMLVFLASLSSVLGGLSSLGFSKIIQRFVPKQPDRAEQIIKHSLLWSSLAGLGTFGVLLIWGPNIEQFSSEPQIFDSLFGVLVLLFVGQWFFEMGSSIFSAFYKAHIGLIANNVTIRILQTILLIFGMTGYLSVLEFIWMFAGLVVLNHGLLFVFSLREIPKPNSTGGVWSLKNGGFDYAIFITVLTLVAQFFLHLDGILVGHFLVLSQLAYLDLAKNLSSVLEMPARAIGASSLAKLSHLLGIGDLKQVGSIYSKASFIQIFLGLILFALIANHIDLLNFWFPDKSYAVVRPLFMVLALGKFVDLATGLNWAIITNSEKYWANLWIGIATLFGVVALEWWMIPQFGLLGAVWGVVLAYLLNNSFRSIYVWMTFRLQPFGSLHKKLLPLAIFAVISSIRLPIPLYLQILAKDGILVLLVLWYAKPGRTLSEWDELVSGFRKKL